MLEFSKSSKVLALSFVALLLLTGAAIRPAFAITTINPTPNFTLTGTPALEGVTYAIVHNGNLWVANYGDDLISEYAGPTYTANEAPTLSLEVFLPQQLAFDSSGNLWVGTWSGHVYEFSAPISNGASPAITLSGLDAPTGVTLYQGSLWVFDVDSEEVYQYNPVPVANAASPPAPILSPDEPMGGVFDASGNLWVANYDTQTVTEYAAPVHTGESISATLTVPGAEVLSSIAMDAAGNLWVASPDPSGVVYKFSAPVFNAETPTSEITVSSDDSIWGISIDASANIWLGDYADAAVYEFTGLASGGAPSYPSTLPPVIANTLPFSFSSSSGTSPAPIVGKLVALQGGVIEYNLPGYNPTKGITPYAVSDCLISSQNEIKVSGFENYQAGANSTEVIVSNYFSILTNAQGWPSEPAC